MQKIENLLEKLKEAQSTDEMLAELEAIVETHGSIAQAIDLPDALLEHLEAQAVRLYREANFSDARSLFQFLAASLPQDKRHWLSLGATCMQLELYEEALKCYGLAQIVEPEDPMPYFFAGFCYSKLHNMDEAKRAFNQVIALSKDLLEWQELKRQAHTFISRSN